MQQEVPRALHSSNRNTHMHTHLAVVISVGQANRDSILCSNSLSAFSLSFSTCRSALFSSASPEEVLEDEENLCTNAENKHWGISRASF